MPAEKSLLQRELDDSSSDDDDILIFSAASIVETYSNMALYCEGVEHLHLTAPAHQLLELQ
jgi:hypothetical protein